VAAASTRTEEALRDAGIEIVELDGSTRLALAIDGADEVDPDLNLIKGGGGALLREKLIVMAAERFVVVAEQPKKVERLGQHWAVPVEVVPFAWRDTRRRLLAVVDSAELRTEADGRPYVTDEGNNILDCAIPAEAAIDELGRELKLTVGVVEHGLFLRMASLALLGRDDGSVERISA
jgi:ribose 5-phosphate isomerase A